MENIENFTTIFTESQYLSLNTSTETSIFDNSISFNNNSLSNISSFNDSIFEPMEFNDTESATIDLAFQCTKGMLIKGITQFGLLFYIHNPSDHYYENAADVKNYEIWVVPALAFMIFLEQIIRLFQRKRPSRVQDMVINVGSAMLYVVLRVYLLSIVVTLFSYIWNNYRFVTLPLNSIWTWILALLLVELFYYWTHRAFHEINILWATHQYHHMAEDLSVTTAIRNSVVDLVFFDVFPIPLSLIIPPPILVVHIQFVLLCQLWIHNEVIPQLGPLEYVINTAGNHRVHHGKNPYCIDKNYSALLMFWDHIFGTYQHEKEQIVFGVVSKHPDTFDMLTLQFGYYKNIINKFQEMEGIKNKLSAIFKGPGWGPGKPRLGVLSDVPEPDINEPKYSYDPYVPLWHKLYVGIHGMIMFLGFYLIADHHLVRSSWSQGIVGMAYIIYSLTAFGAIFDKKSYGPIMEIMRCVFYLGIDYYLIMGNPWQLTKSERTLMLNFIWTVRVFHFASILFWVSRYFIYPESMYIIHKTVNNDLVFSVKDIPKDAGLKGGLKGGFKQLGSGVTIAIIISYFSLFIFIFSIAFFIQIDHCNQLYHRIF